MGAFIRFFLFGLLCLTGCSSLSSLQTARTLPEGDYRLFLGGGFFHTPVTNPSDPNLLQYPFLELGGRFGFLPMWDAGLRYTMPGMFTADVKHTVVEQEEFAIALGAGLGYLGGGNQNQNSKQFDEELIDILFPAYFSYDFSEFWGVYASPRFVYRILQTPQALLGAAIGIRMGNSVGIMLETGAAKDLVSDYTQVQINLGFFFGSGESVR